MAKVAITIEDISADRIKIKIESDPPFPGPAAEDQTLTPAQEHGWVAMDALRQVIEERRNQNDSRTASKS